MPWYRLAVSNMDLVLFWDDTAVSNFDTYWLQIVENICLVIFGRVAKEGQFCRRCKMIFSQNFDQNMANLRHHISN